MNIFRQTLGRPPTQNEVAYFHKSASVAENLLSESTRAMVARHKNEVYVNYVSPEAIAELKDEHLHVGVSLGSNRIGHVDDYDNIDPLMQKYIMHNPVIHGMYKNNLIGGFSDSIAVDKSIDVVNEDMYLRTMSGWVTPDMEEEYGSEYIDGEEELTSGQQLVIQDTWAHVLELLADDTDVTS